MEMIFFHVYDSYSFIFVSHISRTPITCMYTWKSANLIQCSQVTAKSQYCPLRRQNCSSLRWPRQGFADTLREDRPMSGLQRDTRSWLFVERGSSFVFCTRTLTTMGVSRGTTFLCHMSLERKTQVLAEWGETIQIKMLRYRNKNNYRKERVWYKKSNLEIFYKSRES